ncbi:MAG: ABC transporter ATP-binding protein [Methanomassiliicoccales archaeon]|nr:ABC transporter ATP-binding protein [Methanomassiliicoccales archaeon]
MTSSGEISCDGITKAYGRGKTALSEVSFSIPAHGIFAVIGRNGAGKTTLARILSTLLEPSSGRASIDGLDIMLDAKKLRERMAVVPQEGRTVAWMTPVQTVSTYLMWRGVGYNESLRKAKEAVVQVGLEGQANQLNRILSGGMKRKVLVAMVLASDAEFIFLDEPSTGLDPISRQELWRLLIELGKDRFVLLTTHYLEEAERVADRIGILNEGRLVAFGSMEELRGRLSHQYSLKVPEAANISVKEGEKIPLGNGQVQVLTTRFEALDLAKDLIQAKAQFSVNPVTLDDIFTYMVGAMDAEVTEVKEVEEE